MENYPFYLQYFLLSLQPRGMSSSWALQQRWYFLFIFDANSVVKWDLVVLLMGWAGAQRSQMMACLARNYEDKGPPVETTTETDPNRTARPPRLMICCL